MINSLGHNIIRNPLGVCKLSDRWRRLLVGCVYDSYSIFRNCHWKTLEVIMSLPCLSLHRNASNYCLTNVHLLWNLIVKCLLCIFITHLCTLGILSFSKSCFPIKEITTVWGKKKKKVGLCRLWPNYIKIKLHNPATRLEILIFGVSKNGKKD